MLKNMAKPKNPIGAGRQTEKSTGSRTRCPTAHFLNTQWKSLFRAS